MPFCHGRFGDRVSLLLGEADLSLAAVVYAISCSVIDKQGYVKSLEVKVKGLLHENSFFPPIQSAIYSEQDVVTEEHGKVRFFSLNNLQLEQFTKVSRGYNLSMIHKMCPGSCLKLTSIGFFLRRGKK